MKKFIDRALNALNIEWIDDENCTVDAIKEKLKDKDQRLIDMNDQLQELQDLIIDVKELIPDIEDDIYLLTNLLHQINVEEYKELNKGMDVEIY